MHRTRPHSSSARRIARALCALAAMALLAACSDGDTAPPADVTPPRVLMLVANDGFFFQEYFDPRQALEAEGIVVDVASVDGGTAVPHAGSYDGRYTGLAPAVTSLADSLRVVDVDTQDYDALVIVGGWGASRYYYAYPGTFTDTAWQPSAPAAAAANTLIGEFVAGGKDILAVCNGVNVLAWARVPGSGGTVSPLAGRQARAPWGSAPAQSDYLGNDYGSSWTIDQACPWEPVPGSACFRMGRFATDNGAVIPAVYDSVADIADPADTARRDAVAEDGPFITVQDNFAARTGGQRLALRLAAP
jgi:putative intracellular protease/amidase